VSQHDQSEVRDEELRMAGRGAGGGRCQLRTGSCASRWSHLLSTGKVIPKDWTEKDRTSAWSSSRYCSTTFLM